MDVSKKYIEMCEKVFEDIGYIKPTAGPNIMIPAIYTIHQQKPSDLIYVYADKFEDINLTSTIASPIGQLYRQDQLQEMVGDDTGFRTQINLIDKMLVKCVNEIGYGLTWEKLWLRIVMKEKYQKVWDGNIWIKEKP